MVSLQNKILYLLLLIPSFLLGQTYNYTYTDPCTLNQQSIIVPIGDQVVLNYFGKVQAFNQQDFSNGVFDNWLTTVSQLNSSAPCQSVTEVIINETNGTTVANTLTVVTNIMSVMGGGMLPPVESINNSSRGNNSESEESESEEEDEQNTQTNGSNSNQSGGSNNTQTNQSNQETQGNQSSSQTGGGSNTETTTGAGNTTNPIQGGEQTSSSPVGNQSQSNSNTNNSNTNNSNTSPSQGTNAPTQISSTTEASSNSGSTGANNQNNSQNTSNISTQSAAEEAEGSAAQSTANSLSNAIDGGSGGGNKKSNKAQKNAGSLIASGDIVVISNQDNSNGSQFRFVGSITHANTRNTRIKGALFTYTSVTNDFSLTFYKSWINPKKTFNLVLANTTMYNFESNLLNTTTALESFRFGKGKKYTGMAGVNFTYGKLGERNLQNLSSVAGVHRNLQVTPRISTSLLVLGVYSPFTQFYEGKWWDAGVLVVPFSSWDIKITKTFKYNISFTGVYQTSGNFLNYQVLTGGKLNF